MLGPDLFVTVLQFLPSTDVARAAGVCRKWRELTSDHGVWQRLLAADFDLGPSDRYLAAANPKECYARRLTQRQRRVRLANASHAQGEKTRLLTNGQAQRDLRVGFCALTALLCFPFWAVLAVMVMVGTRLHTSLDDPPPGAGSSASSGPSWWWPGGLTLAAIVFGIAACGLLYWAASPHLRDDTGVIESGGVTPFPMLRPCVALHAIHRRSSRTVVCLWWLLVAAAAACAPLPIAWKLQEQASSEAAASVKWGAIFTPLWVLFGLSTCSCCVFAAMRLNSLAEKSVAVMFGAVCWLFVLLVLITVKLDARPGMALQLVFIPLWCVLGVFALAACLTACGGCIKFLLDRDPVEFGFICAFVGALVLAAGPPIATLVLSVLRVQGVIDTSWSAIFAPMYAWLSLLALAATGFCLAVFEHTVVKPWLRWRRDASDPFAVEFGRYSARSSDPVDLV
jgi:hypothetical protein